MALEHRVNGHPTKITSGNRWFRLWKKRHPEYTSRTPQLVESDRADARLTRAEWKRFFFEVVRLVYNEIAFDKSRIYNLDESWFFRQFITNSGARKVITKRGCNDVYVGMACIRADGIGNVPLTLIFKTKKVKGDWFRHGSTPVVLLGNGTGWSTAADFQVYLERVFQHYTGCSDTEDGRVVLLVDGSKTHLTGEVLAAAKQLGVFLICFPSHSTDVVQPLDVSIFAPLKRKIRRGQDRWLRSHRGRSLTHSRFVELVTSAWGSVAGTTQVKESFRVTGLFPLSFDEFTEHAQVPRIRDDMPALNIGIEPPDEGVANASGNNDPHPLMADASSQVCSRAINSAMRDDPTSMNIGGFVTSEEYIRACTAANSTRASAAQPSRQQCPRRAAQRSASTGTSPSQRRAVARDDYDPANPCLAVPSTSTQLRRGRFVVNHKDRRNTQNQPRAERAARRLQRESDYDSDSDAPAAKRICSDFCSDYEVQLFLSAASRLSDS